LIDKNLGFRLYRRMLIQENKWRAVRYGLEGKLIDFGKQTEVPVRDLILELLEFVDDVVDPLGSRKEIDHIHRRITQSESQCCQSPCLRKRLHHYEIWIFCQFLYECFLS